MSRTIYFEIKGFNPLWAMHCCEQLKRKPERGVCFQSFVSMLIQIFKGFEQKWSFQVYLRFWFYLVHAELLFGRFN